MLRLAALLMMAIAAPAIAGTMFRLEIGPPIAAGTGAATPQFKKKVVLAVRPRVCDNPAAVQITGTAEGLVNGMRQSVPLTLIAVNQAEGVYAVQQQWPDTGQWLLQLNGSCPSPKASASTLVPMKGSTFVREKTEVLREPATRQQVDPALAVLVRSVS
jgi:hypothetical protein